MYNVTQFTIEEMEQDIEAVREDRSIINVSVLHEQLAEMAPFPIDSIAAVMNRSKIRDVDRQMLDKYTQEHLELNAAIVGVALGTELGWMLSGHEETVFVALDHSRTRMEYFKIVRGDGAIDLVGIQYEDVYKRTHLSVLVEQLGPEAVEAFDRLWRTKVKMAVPKGTLLS